MRAASSYRGARRNYARDNRALGDWRRSSHHVVAANFAAKLYDRSVMANAAREAASKAVVEATGNGHPVAGAAQAAFLAFYKAQKRTRVVGRILRDLGARRRLAKARGVVLDDVAQAAAAYKVHGSERKAAQALGIAKTTLHTRLKRAAERGLLAITRTRKARAV